MCNAKWESWKNTTRRGEGGHSSSPTLGGAYRKKGNGALGLRTKEKREPITSDGRSPGREGKKDDLQGGSRKKRHRYGFLGKQKKHI